MKIMMLSLVQLLLFFNTKARLLKQDLINPSRSRAVIAEVYDATNTDIPSVQPGDRWLKATNFNAETCLEAGFESGGSK